MTKKPLLVAIYKKKGPAHVNSLHTPKKRGYYPPIPFLASLLLGVVVCGLTAKTPNYGWMGVLDKDVFFSTFPKSFLSVRIPVLRPYLFVEFLNYRLFGNFWIAENLGYGLIGGSLFYLFYKCTAFISHPWTPFVIFSLIFPAYIWGASGGQVYDILFCFGLSLLVYLFHTYPFDTHQKTVIHLFPIAISLWICDMARPYFLMMLPIIFIFIFFRLHLRNTLIVLFSVFIVALPFHYLQYRLTGDITLSNYAGINLREVFPIGPVYDQPMDRSEMNSEETTKLSGEYRAAIISELMHNPSILRYAITTKRLFRLLFPQLDWHGASFRTIAGEMRPLFLFSLCCLYGYWGVGIYWSFRRRRRRVEAGFVLCLVLQLVLINVLSHDLREQIRIFLPTISVVFISAICLRCSCDSRVRS